MGLMELPAVMERAVQACREHVEAGGLPFVGVVVDHSGLVVSGFGVNRVQETGESSAHAEIVAMREAMASHGLGSLTGTTLLATGEPCGLCYRFAIDHGVEAVHVALDRDEVAGLGFDYRASYPVLGITDDVRAALLHRFPVERAAEPFTSYLHAQPTGADEGTSTTTPAPRPDLEGTP